MVFWITELVGGPKRHPVRRGSIVVLAIPRRLAKIHQIVTNYAQRLFPKAVVAQSSQPQHAEIPGRQNN